MSMAAHSFMLAVGSVGWSKVSPRITWGFRSHLCQVVSPSGQSRDGIPQDLDLLGLLQPEGHHFDLDDPALTPSK